MENLCPQKGPARVPQRLEIESNAFAIKSIDESRRQIERIRLSKNSPFQIEVSDGLVLVSGLEWIHEHLTRCEKVLPTLNAAMNNVVDQGHTAFVFDALSLGSVTDFPLLNWVAMYGLFVRLRKR